MDIIKLLPDIVANQIAAGEVVQRPASVVKELLENAVDAGATSITVNIKEGGRELIQVIDNGCGFSPGDAARAFDRHATSKIADASDIYRLSTFGFRGEALASIASVAEVELRTRRKDDDAGTMVRINAGELVERSPVNTPCGAQFLVKNLFYNIPARRKFLKSNSVETRHIVAEFTRVALCNPQVEMSLYNNGTCLYDLAPTNLRQRIVAMTGRQMNQSLTELSVRTSIISIEGFIGTPQSARKSCSDQYLFVNDRYFRSPYFHKAVVSAYDKLIRPDVQPPYFLYMTVDTSRIDVNIHPSKTEIKFEDEQAVWQIINAAVRESLGKSGGVPMMDFDGGDPIDIPVFRGGTAVEEPPATLNPSFNPFEKETGGGRYAAFGMDAVPKGWEVLHEGGYDTFDRSSGRGDSFRTFITAEEQPEHEEQEFVSAGFASGEDEWQPELDMEHIAGAPADFVRITDRYAAVPFERSLRIIDLKRARERILYEKFLDRRDDGFSANQQELFAEPVAVSPEDARILGEMGESLAQMGFDMEIEDSGVVLRGVPAGMGELSAPEMIDSLLRGIKEHGRVRAQEMRERAAAIMAESCSSWGGRTLRDEEVADILSELSACREPAHTASGKTVMTVINEEEIIKRLK